ncbi:MAG: MBL fold metallo-hydrolase [Methanolinea sp.]|jgi:7,8-dihydropterin-6-yl-methyl-4-(beta-D-ribofuranosyl)aminobenzene 5'-phosphate synthase|nr:MBL fold metallo-hydrolase [Methanolinea sp.]
MRLKVLADNSTLIDRYYLAEPGFSALVETGEGKVLFDLGYSDVFLKNALKMGESLLDLRYVVLSHGHLDHTWGLVHLVMALTEAQIEKRDYRRPDLVAHPDVFLTKQSGRVPESGSLLSEEKCREHFALEFSREPLWLSKDLVFLGEIPRKFAFESPESGRMRKRHGALEPDIMADDSALAWRGRDGLVVITGCSHAGICNIVARAREVCREERVQDIIGGFHLMTAPESRLDAMVATLAEMGVTRMHPCHCTGFKAVHRLAESFLVEDTGSGMVCEYN